MKVGLELFCRTGPSVVDVVRGGSGVDLFLDLKLHDILNTVAGAARSVARLQPRYLTVHAVGGADMVRAAVEAAHAGLAGQPVNLRSAMVAVDPATGGVLAYYGGDDGTGLDYARVRRLAGSTFKPFVVLAGLRADPRFAELLAEVRARHEEARQAFDAAGGDRLLGLAARTDGDPTRALPPGER